MNGFLKSFALAATLGLSSCISNGPREPESLYDSVEWNDPKLHPDRVYWDKAQSVPYEDVIAKVMPETDMLFLGLSYFKGHEKHDPYALPFSDQAIEAYKKAHVVSMFMPWSHNMTEKRLVDKIAYMRSLKQDDGTPYQSDAMFKALDADIDFIPVNPLNEGMLFYNAIDRMSGRQPVFNSTSYDRELASIITDKARDIFYPSGIWKKEKSKNRKVLIVYDANNGTRKDDGIPEEIIKRDLNFVRIDIYPNREAFFERLRDQNEQAAKIQKWDRQYGRTAGEDFPDFIYLTEEDLLVPTDETQPRLLHALGFNVTDSASPSPQNG
ncbi:MAG: hypothetical protein GC137_06245 [Alphaproteobacteria bacterium]|nr:hypothetical protein [Alphaproteobacteria bacterium]